MGGCVLIARLEIAQCIGSIVDGTTCANPQLGTLDETDNCRHQKCYQIWVTLVRFIHIPCPSNLTELSLADCKICLVLCMCCEQIEVDLVETCFPHR